MTINIDVAEGTSRRDLLRTITVGIDEIHARLDTAHRPAIRGALLDQLAQLTDQQAGLYNATGRAYLAIRARQRARWLATWAECEHARALDPSLPDPQSLLAAAGEDAPPDARDALRALYRRT